MKRRAVLLAGGRGTRLYPLSTRAKPKQFLTVFGERSLLQETADRLDWVVEPDERIVSTTREYEGIAREQFNGKIIAEPEGKGTFLSVLLSIWGIYEDDPNTVVVVLPTDHYVSDGDMYRLALSKAVIRARWSGNVVLIGERARYPETDYGYIRCQGRKVIGFEEKPTEQRAKELVEEDAAWNCGIFVFRAGVMVDAYKRLYPEYWRAFKTAHDGQAVPVRLVDGIYKSFPGGGIERMLIEKMDNLAVVRSSFGWCDIGSLERLEKVRGEGVGEEKQVNS